MKPGINIGELRPGNMRSARPQSSNKWRPPRPHRRWRNWFTGFLLLAALPAFVLLPLRWINPPVSSFMLQSTTPLAERRWVDEKHMGPYLALAAVASEDQKFPQHFGFDFEALVKVINAPGAPSRGASTISQQTSKNLFLWPGGYVRKALEAWITVWLELLWPKQRILEVYLNIAEFAPGVYGVWGGAQHYFGQAPATLDRTQAARMIAVLPSPQRLTINTPAVHERGQWIEQQMRQLGPVYLQ